VVASSLLVTLLTSLKRHLVRAARSAAYSYIVVYRALD
jgi:hypothetical protein